jgi:hypothetical protein
MPVEFALRPRIRLREGVAPRKRRWRLRVPRFLPHVLGYWALIGGICYAVVRSHGSAEPERSLEQPSAEEPTVTTLSAPPSAPSDPQLVAAEAPALAPTGAATPALAGPSLAEPSLAEPSLAEPALAEPALAEPALAEPALAEPALAEPALAEPAHTPHAGTQTGAALPSCESAAASAVQSLDFSSSDRTADLPSSVIAGVLENGAWLSTCNVPASTHLGVCVAIKHGQVTAATVISRPADAALEACVKARAAALQFPYSNRQDIARTQF